MPPVIHFKPIASKSGIQAAFEITLQGFAVPDAILLELVEVDIGELVPSSRTQLLGTIKGETSELSKAKSGPPVLSFVPRDPVITSSGPARVAFVFPQPDKSRPEFVFDLPSDSLDRFEGDTWELQAVTHDPMNTATITATSATHTVARVRRALGTASGPATYAWHAGHTVQFYHDGATGPTGGGALTDIEKAIDQAEHFVFIADWSFHPYMRMRRDSAVDFESTVGAQLVRKAHGKPECLIAIHTWDHTNVAAPDTQNDNAESILDKISKSIFKKGRPDNLRWRASSRTGIGFSHHQKFVVCDAPGAKGRRNLIAFIGGLDLTKGRFDWPEHKLFDSPTGSFRAVFIHAGNSMHRVDDWYSAEFWADKDADGDPKNPGLPRQPWHDTHARIAGPGAWDLVREFVGRWNLDPSASDAMGDDGSDDIKAVLDRFLLLFKATLDDGKTKRFVQQWEMAFGPWSAQLYRSMKKEHWGSDSEVKTPARTGERKEFEWKLSGDREQSIQRAYVQAISQADRFIYIENQYLIGSGDLWGRSTVANGVPKAIANRVIEKANKGDPFHVYIVVPMFPEGAAGDAGNGAVRQFEWKTIRAMADRVRKGIKGDWRDFLSFYFLANWEDRSGTLTSSGTRIQRVVANRRYMIYVHTKMMIVDDRYVILGSANLNERSLNGARDSEIAIGLWPTTDKLAPGCVKQVLDFRKELWKEHLGPGLPGEFANPEIAPCFKAVQAAAAHNYKMFRIGVRTADAGHLCQWPILVDDKGLRFDAVSGAPEGDDFLPDSADKGNVWRWDAPGPHSVFPLGDLTKPGQDVAE
jgi:phospholipase D1/2